MPRRLARLAVLLPLVLIAFSGSPLSAEAGTGARELAAGREALARRQYPAAVEHLRSAVSTLDSERERVALGDAWLQLGIAYLNGLDEPEAALSAFQSSITASPEPSTAYLWASVTAEILGRSQEAIAYRVRAIQPPPAVAPLATTPAPKLEAPAPVTPAPEAAPAAPEAPAPEAKPVEPAAAAPQEEPDAVQHFFGAEATAEPKPAPEAKPAEPSQPKEKEKVDAVQYFFGEKEDAPAPEAKPPV